MGAVELEPRVARVLCRLGEALDREGLAYALIGATALLLRGVALRRSTRDLDLVVAVGLDRSRLGSALRAAGLVAVRGVEHRFLSDPEGVSVDLLTLDDRAAAEGRITLADGASIPAAGMAEAVRLASEVAVEGGRVRVAPLPILVVLKLVAASERRWGEQDLEDACAAMIGYHGEDDRRYFEVDYATQPGLLFETAGAFLLAQDALAEEATVRVLRQVVAALLADRRLTEGGTLGRRCAPLLRVFAQGLGLSQPEGRAGERNGL